MDVKRFYFEGFAVPDVDIAASSSVRRTIGYQGAAVNLDVNFQGVEYRVHRLGVSSLSLNGLVSGVVNSNVPLETWAVRAFVEVNGNLYQINQNGGAPSYMSFNHLQADFYLPEPVRISRIQLATIMSSVAVTLPTDQQFRFQFFVDVEFIA